MNVEGITKKGINEKQIPKIKNSTCMTNEERKKNKMIIQINDE